MSLRAPEREQHDRGLSASWNSPFHADFCSRGNGTWSCVLCANDPQRPGQRLWHAIAHENTLAHQARLEKHREDLELVNWCCDVPGEASAHDVMANRVAPVGMGYMEDGGDVGSNARETEVVDQGPLGHAGSSWYTGEWVMSNDTSHEAMAIQAAARAVGSWLNEYQEAQGADEDSDSPGSPQHGGDSSDGESGGRFGMARPRGMRQDSNWAPWDDKVACAMDIISNMARSTLSDMQTTLLQWLLRASLQKELGVQSVRRVGSLGHTYYTNDMAQVLAQEMSNPLVRPHLGFYPEATHTSLDDAFQGSRWLKEMHPALLTPMVRVRGQDYFVLEPVMLRDGSVVMFHRWLTMEQQEGMWGRGWRMQTQGMGEGQGWTVDRRQDILVSERDLLMNFPTLQQAYADHGIPPPNRVLGSTDIDGSHMAGWGHAMPNRWRALAKGHRVLSVPIWLYCDDTSGNRSKKWNEHYSWLFSLAGLPKSAAKGGYHIHFICTSNVAHALEMMEGVVEHIEALYRDGVWAFDCEYGEMVLLFTAVLALLGDNPMQSKTAMMTVAIPTIMPRDMVHLHSNVLRFMDASLPARWHSKTVHVTAQMLSHMQQMMPRTAYRVLGMENGVKDPILHHFATRLYNVCKGHRKMAAEPAQYRMLQTLPKEPFNPVWHLRDVDPHAHTPVEILHVLLLGIVRYFWRDAVARMSDVDKQTVITHLSCLNVDGLGPAVSRMVGHTFVQYAGSLVGRDFRTVIQLALFSLYDILPAPALKAWVALSALMPIIWQNHIEDAQVYVATLRTRIHYFMDCVLAWTPRWFNKPKFHILLHLPDHVLAFGPAVLFATESFESFNAVIRAWSIHSNRSAPLRDISSQAAHCNRVRHLMSGGYFHVEESSPTGDPTSRWTTAGHGPAVLVRQPMTNDSQSGANARRRVLTTLAPPSSPR
ncbi:hypothetical protein JB92DRAFT_3118557 [Gautieria morchelliformis]|nr:hypothetical protein JB92DRAFT_3118557 [Gautieria morchelliformis]